MNPNKENALNELIYIEEEREALLDKLKAVIEQRNNIISRLDLLKEQVREVCDTVGHTPPFTLVRKDLIYKVTEDFSISSQLIDYIIKS